MSIDTAKLAAVVLIAPALLLAPTACSMANTARVNAAATLAEQCQSKQTDAARNSGVSIVAEGPSVTVRLTEDARKVLNVVRATELSADNASELTNGGSFMDGMGVMFATMAASKCLADGANTPTDAKGLVKPGEFPDWTVAVDDWGAATMTSTLD